MSKIFKNMIPYWKSILVILVLLFVQAWCDLSLPSYTSDIIDVGIQDVYKRQGQDGSLLFSGVVRNIDGK